MWDIILYIDYFSLFACDNTISFLFDFYILNANSITLLFFNITIFEFIFIHLCFFLITICLYFNNVWCLNPNCHIMEYVPLSHYILIPIFLPIAASYLLDTCHIYILNFKFLNFFNLQMKHFMNVNTNASIKVKYLILHTNSCRVPFI